MKHDLTLVCILLTSQLGLAQNLDLLGLPQPWQANLDRATTQMTVAPTPDARLAVDIAADGAPEDYPKLRQEWAEPQDWSRFMRLNVRMRITSDAPGARDQHVAWVFYDAKTLRDDLPERPMTQQCINHTVPLNRWVDLRDWLTTIHRTAIRQVDLYLYEMPPAAAHRYRVEFARLGLDGVGEQATMFDTEVYDRNGLRDTSSGQPAGTVRTDDGLGLAFGANGAVTAVTADATQLGTAAGTLTGLLVRDVTTEAPPHMAGGAITAGPNQVQQSAKLDDLGLAIEATCKSAGNRIEITGTVTDLRGQDRAVTVYFALPLAEAPWQWWDSAALARVKPDTYPELACLEPNVAYGLNGMHSKYPIGAISWPEHGGLTLGVRMDEPVVHRIAYNPNLRLLYIAMDFGLVPETNVRGRSLAQAPFRILIYRHDPAWGFRSALRRYYDAFPEFFEKRVKREGGWYVWGNMNKTAGALEAGFGCHWDPGGNDAVKWDNENNVLSLFYIEPETYQQTMEDYDRAPTYDEVMARLQKIATGDEAELKQVESQPYRVYPLTGLDAPVRQKIQTTAQVVLGSFNYGPDAQPYSMIGQIDWMNKTKWGAIFSCNIAPGIPNGKGQFNRQQVIEPGLESATKAGAHYDGVGLDSFGGFGQLSRVNYRREHFRYSNLPLSFSASERQPVQVGFFATLEWLRELAKDLHSRNLVIMANCCWGATPGWLTFAAPYLDIFGAEATKFGEPDLIRAIAFRKVCTDLPYKPQPDWELPWHMLHAIFPEAGNKVEDMPRYAAILRDLAGAGWEPITNARVQPDTVRIERYGNAPAVYFVVHNPADSAVSASVRIDSAALGLTQFAAQDALTNAPLKVAAAALQLDLPAKATLTVVLRPQP